MGGGGGLPFFTAGICIPSFDSYLAKINEEDNRFIAPLVLRPGYSGQRRTI
jgi:hypothetical protein